MFRNFIQRVLDILELVLGLPHVTVLLVNRSKAVPLQWGFRTVVLELLIIIVII
jgi:hypothetical protein